MSPRWQASGVTHRGDAVVLHLRRSLSGAAAPTSRWRPTVAETPNPGSDEAIEQGCVCPVLDNHHGRGWDVGDGKQLFVTNADCPLHGIEAK